MVPHPRIDKFADIIAASVSLLRLSARFQSHKWRSRRWQLVCNLRPRGVFSMRLHVYLRLATSLLFVFILSSAARAGQTTPVQPADWDSGLRLPEASDTNPDSQIVEVNLD